MMNGTIIGNTDEQSTTNDRVQDRTWIMAVIPAA